MVAFFYLVISNLIPITFIYHLLVFYYQTSWDKDGKLLSLTINESIEDYRYEKMACSHGDSWIVSSCLLYTSQLEENSSGVRLLGVTLTGLEDQEGRQLDLDDLA